MSCSTWKRGDAEYRPRKSGKFPQLKGLYVFDCFIVRSFCDFVLAVGHFSFPFSNNLPDLGILSLVYFVIWLSVQ